MANADTTIFNKSALEKLRSPDDLDKYLRVANPSTWIILLACMAFVLGLLSWGIFGSVSTGVDTTGTVMQGRALCFLSADDVAKVTVGDEASVGGVRCTVADVAAIPLSKQEAKEVLQSDYLVDSLVDGDWGYQVTFDGDVSSQTEGVPVTVNITTERVAPIRQILGSSA